MTENKLVSPILDNDADAIVNMVVRRFVAAHGRLPMVRENIFDDDSLIGMPFVQSDGNPSAHTVGQDSSVAVGRQAMFHYFQE